MHWTCGPRKCRRRPTAAHRQFEILRTRERAAARSAEMISLKGRLITEGLPTSTSHKKIGATRRTGDRFQRAAARSRSSGKTTPRPGCAERMPLWRWSAGPTGCGPFTARHCARRVLVTRWLQGASVRRGRRQLRRPRCHPPSVLLRHGFFGAGGGGRWRLEDRHGRSMGETRPLARCLKKPRRDEL